MTRSRAVLSLLLLASAIAAGPAACSDFKGAGTTDDAGTNDPAADGAASEAGPEDGGVVLDGAPGDGAGGDSGQATCTAAACPPVTMAADLHVPFALAVNATHLYWLERGAGSDLDGELVRVAKSGPCLYADAGCRGILDNHVAGSVIDFVTLGLGPSDVCFTETYNFPAEHSLSCLSLGTGAKRTVHQGSGAGGDVAVGADTIVWADYGTAASSSNGSVFRVAEDAGFTASPPTVATGRPGPHGVALAGSDVFWSENGTGDAGGAIYRALLDGGSRATLATGQGDPRSVAVFDDYVYWVNVTGGSVERKKKDGTGTVEHVATGQVLPFAIVVDASGVYWINGGSAPDYLDGSLRHVPLGGGRVTEMIGDVANISALAVDGAYAYVASMGTVPGNFIDGKILRIAKTH